MKARRGPQLSDEQVIDRLRDTFRHEADSLSPFGERVRAIAAIEARQAHLAAVRRRVAAGTVAAVVAAAVVAALLVLPGAAKPQPVNVAATPGTQFPQVHQPVTNGTPSHLSAPPRALSAMPGSFVPLSVTFVPTPVGWVLGTVTCGAERCMAIAHTTDAGATWTQLPRPSVPGTTVTLPAEAAAAARLDLGIRFAAGGHGWIFGNLGGAPLLWATDDGGRTWQDQALPDLGTGVAIDALETNDGLVQMVASTADPAAVHLLTWDIVARSWTVSPTVLPVTSADTTIQLVLQQAGAWVVEDRGDRLVGAATYDMATATWSPWRAAPCGGAAAQVAAAVQAEVLAVCSQAGTTSAANSSDGGTSFQASGGTWPAGLVPEAVAASGAHDLVVGGTVAGNGTIEVGSGAGSQWGRAWSSPTYTSVRQLGFESAYQGVAVVSSAGGAELLVTRDGGQAWTPVRFSV